MVEYIMLYMDKEIDPKIPGFYLHYNNDHRNVTVGEIKNNADLKDKKNKKIPYPEFPCGKGYLWVIEIQHIDEGPGEPYQTAYIPINEFEKWVEKPYQYKKLRKIYPQFIEAIQGYFNWTPNPRFEDV